MRRDRPVFLAGVATLAALTSLAMGSPAPQAQSAATLEQRVKALQPTKSSVADCKAQVSGAAASNGPDLLHRGQLCALAMMPVETSFLMLAGQLRATVDILLLPPATQADDRSLATLYGMLWAGGGMSGVNDDVLHDSETRARFFAMLDAWQPTYPPAYEPGWQARKRPDAAAYLATMSQVRVDLRKRLDRLVRLDSDDAFFAMQAEYNAILARIPQDGLAPDTVAGKRAGELERRLRARGLALGIDMGPPPPDPATFAADRSQLPAVQEPPAAPGRGEKASAASDRVVVMCTDQAERAAVRNGHTIARSLVTVSARWGVVLRADIEGGTFGPERFTCSADFTGEQPFSVRALRLLSGPIKR